jgi:hypothetical protein
MKAMRRMLFWLGFCFQCICALTGIHFLLNAMVFPRMEGTPEWLYHVFRFLLIISCTFFPIAWESRWIIGDIKKNRHGANTSSCTNTTSCGVRCANNALSKQGKRKIIRLSWPGIFQIEEEGN